MSSFLGLDTIIAFGLIGITIILFLISRMGILPKKSLPYIAAALVGIFAAGLVRKWRQNKTREELKKREEKLKERESKLEGIRGTSEASDKKLEEMKAELDRHRAAYEKEILLIGAENKENKEIIDRLSGEELHNKFREAFPPS